MASFGFSRALAELEGLCSCAFVSLFVHVFSMFGVNFIDIGLLAPELRGKMYHFTKFCRALYLILEHGLQGSLVFYRRDLPKVAKMADQRELS